ncbi:tRNA-dihydrouridine(16/17) synthase [Escovopsis weberi]|uniref:tRNA-dihydrouridine(16/17) synthase [NAD(P)(+)] n=1 Tax=Escovopsis weberi TaxID=150374 RepID=A0A0M9VST4_ESCWE|nr:tRNA-dihydrouridine(16/17) synthase [Escovopsis weberi]
MTADAAPKKERKKLHGRAFYESIGSPKYIVAPMVDQSEFAWRMLTRSFIPADEQSSVLAYTPMLHARLFSQEPKYRAHHFQALRPGMTDEASNGPVAAAGAAEEQEQEQMPWLDGNPALDRPLFVQFCANDPEALLAAAREVAPHCDAVDLNLGCPQGIARKGHYGAFLQEDQELVFRLINTLHRELPVPVTAKIRILDTREATLAYARNVLAAGASILTVHGRRREQKGHLTGVADWDAIRFLRDSLPPDTVLFANGNVLQPGDLERCLAATGADGVMAAEGNLSDPALFARPPPPGEEGREYWRGTDGRGGWRVDAIARRYMDILHRYALGAEPPARRPLFVPGDDASWLEEEEEGKAGEGEGEGEGEGAEQSDDGPARKKRRTEGGGGGNSSGSGSGNSRKEIMNSPNLTAVQPHLFHLLRHFVSKHTDIRDQLARAKRDGMAGYEAVLGAVEKRVAQGLLEYERTGGAEHEGELAQLAERQREQEARGVREDESSVETMRRCKRPWWVAQPIIRPLPSEALAKGAIQPKKAKEAKEAKEGKGGVAGEEEKHGKGNTTTEGEGAGVVAPEEAKAQAC